MQESNIKTDLDLLTIISDLKTDIFQKITQLERLVRDRIKKDYEILNRRNGNNRNERKIL